MIKHILNIVTLTWFFGFQLCVAQLPSSCEDPLNVCELDTIHLKSHRITTEINDIVNMVCGIEDMAVSTMYQGANWLRYEFATAGEFLFTLYPSSMHTDLDFYLFKSNGDCNSLSNIRCMLSGSLDIPRCMGTTGLREESMDTYEYAGCDYFDDNYVSSVYVQPGDVLYLAIYNFSKDDTDYRIVNRGTASLTCNPNLVKARVEVYPNPTAGKLRIFTQNIDSPEFGLEIFDQNGKNHLRQSIDPKEEIDINFLPSGVYIIRLHNDGELLCSKKIINIK